MCLCSITGGVVVFFVFFFLMIRRPPRSTQSRSSAASDVYKRQVLIGLIRDIDNPLATRFELRAPNPLSNTYLVLASIYQAVVDLSLIHISEPTRLLSISYAVFCLKKKTTKKKTTTHTSTDHYTVSQTS